VKDRALTTSTRTLLLTGATGFVGAAVYPALTAAGWRVRCMSRDPLRAQARWPEREWVAGDVTDADACEGALAGCDAALYLVHGMGEGGDYHEREVAAATSFAAAAARAGVQRVVYLGGVAPRGAGGSEHLRSRRDVGEALRAGAVTTIELRASMIVGHGSLSWLMVRDLAARLPFMVLPTWLKSRTQPIAIDDVVAALVSALTLSVNESAWFDLPGPETLSGKEILERSAQVMGLGRPVMVEVPMLTPRLSSLWVRFVTRAQWSVAREVVVGLTEDLLASDERFWEKAELGARVPFDQAAARALAAEQPEGAMPGPWGLVERARRRDPLTKLAFMSALLWLVAASGTHAVGIWTALGLVAVLLGGVAWRRDPEAVLSLRPTLGRLALGTVAGGVMIVATYLLYPVFTRAAPFLAQDTAALYTAFRAAPPLIATLALLPVILGEELVWRGVVQRACTRRWGPWRGCALAALIYAGVHAPLGSPVLALAALLCGMTWGALRVASRTLVPALVAHILWDLFVLLFLPLDAR
jgi:uncharacterized protein YbjT (DUF2867 family)/membrane protease YdiL (CAAX protease family)